MRTSRALILASIAASGLLLAGCKATTSGVTTTAVTTGTGHAAASSAASAAAKAGLGSAINLKGVDSGDEIQVTLVKIADPDQATDGFSTPDAGDRYVSVEFQILDNGTTPYQDDPAVDAAVKDAAGQAFQSTIVTSTAAGPQMDSSTNLAPGDKALGWITFEVPTADKVSTVQYGLNGGMAGAVGEWTVG